MNKKLYRDEYHKVIGGVCSGLAEYFDMDPTVVRLLFAFSFFAGGVGLVPYVILWIVLPKKGHLFNDYNGRNFNNSTVDYTVPPVQPEDHFYTPPTDGGTRFGSDPYTGSAYATNPVSDTYRPKPRSNAGVIAGMVLIIIGAAILIDNYDLIPDFDFGRLWPVILVLAGAAIIVSGQKNKHGALPDWQHADKKDAGTAGSPAAAADTQSTEL